MNLLFASFKKGIDFFKGNPQVIYTALLILVIPMAFILSNQQFLNVAKTAQGRLEKERIGMMQDVFVAFASARLSDREFLQQKIEELKKQNEILAEIKLVRLEDNVPKIAASLRKEEIGTTDEADQQYLAMASLNPSSSFIIEIFPEGVRKWKAVRAILDENKTLSGFLVTEISMAESDRIIAENLTRAYYFLLIILVAILLLLIRQARLIDYSKLYNRLQEVDKMKDDFISMAAHELRTPLTAIKGYADLVSEVKGLSERDKDNLAIIKISADRLNSLVADILDVSRLSQGRLVFNFQAVDPSDIIKKEMKYERKALPKISIDPIRFEQALVNLVGNAIKYTPKGKIEVLTEEAKGKLYIRIADTGLGISAEEQRRLFEKFYRIQTKETQEIIGTGLGLWITKELIEKMGGMIMVESIKGMGAHFIISFSVKT
ncbi:MAG: Two-component sensor histidine kinase [Candidatus Azambacteria bacterium GW2011_GWE2_46_45]|uniref:histidine kinase n=1 Tax=Candidatus Azambacteria bacterium GW2011_GWE2_46_45 TaxID=1618625 RepID=A0A0G1Q330_9BACT|nr:MAG: Two-component sensor histidine kinase [Candidatus Azambacteria bacterium GW2011_GWE2_46_45]